jgi:glycosyltransferase involved in cell wall biosynthesis
MRTLTVVIPVYRSERILRQLYRQLTTALEEIGSEFETIFVEDGGGDDSWSIIVDLAARTVRCAGCA